MGVKHIHRGLLRLLCAANGNRDKGKQEHLLTGRLCFVHLVLFPKTLEYIRSSGESREADLVLLLSLMHLLKTFDV